MRLIKVIAFFFVSICCLTNFHVYGVEKSNSLKYRDKSGIREYSRMIKEEIGKVKSIDPQSYFKEIDKYRQLIERYIKNKKMVCNGEFSTLVLSDSEIMPFGDKIKLSKEERKLCLREIKNMQVAFIRNSFVAKKNYLDYLHKQRIGDLINAKEKMIKSLQKGI